MKDKYSDQSPIDWDFAKEMSDVEPMKSDDTVFHNQSQQERLAKQLKKEAIERELGSYRNYLTTEAVDPVRPDDVLEYKKDGVQHGVYKNLRLGKYPLDKSLNLQSMAFKDIHEKVFNFIMECYRNGKRSILIRHGMGINSKPYPAFIKSYINNWLRAMPEVLAFHTALKRHGGYGATYILLKKNVS